MSKIDGINQPKPNQAKQYLINGDMRIAQRGTSFAAIADSTYSLDRIRYNKSGSMIHTITQDTSVPTLSQANYLFQNSLRLNLTTADTSIAAGDYAYFTQIIEGFNWVNLAQKIFTLSFWVRATLTGTYCVSFRNTGADRSYVAEYTINTTETWEYKTITVSASPSAGTWNYGSGQGLFVRWSLAGGTTYQTTANAWQTGDFHATSNQVNGVNTGATDFRITGVMLNEGPVAAPFRLFGEDIEGELAACQRYLHKLIGPASGSRAVSTGTLSSATAISRTPIIFPVVMRSTPILTFNSLAAFDGTTQSSISASSGNFSDEKSFDGDWTTSGLGAAGRAVVLLLNGSTSYMQFDAEL